MPDGQPIIETPLAEAASADKLSDLASRARRERARAAKRRPKRVADLVAGVVAARGITARRSGEPLREAWQSAVEAALGDAKLARQTRLAGVRRGVAEVVMTSSVLVQELTFHKPRLLEALRNASPDGRIASIRFKVGPPGD